MTFRNNTLIRTTSLIYSYNIKSSKVFTDLRCLNEWRGSIVRHPGGRATVNMVSVAIGSDVRRSIGRGGERRLVATCYGGVTATQPSTVHPDENVRVAHVCPASVARTRRKQCQLFIFNWLLNGRM